MDAQTIDKTEMNGKRDVEIPNPLSGSWIGSSIIRKKNPEVDLRLKYRKVYNISMALSFVLMAGVAVAFPKFEPRQSDIKREQVVIEIQDLPETRQVRRPPPPPRPAVPIETESEDVPDDVTIETTELDFDDIAIDLPLPPPPGLYSDAEEQEEILEFWAVEQEPKVVQEVWPVYPEVARKAGLEGTVFLQFTVGKDGKVRDIQVLRGSPIFVDAAVKAMSQFVFEPAIQNDQPVSVRMAKPIRFRLKKSG
ncbi:MAG: energy transducer TonB [bacterium]|nr:energy transducer TonB [bacterium]